jgi:hypothetical protein
MNSLSQQLSDAGASLPSKLEANTTPVLHGRINGGKKFELPEGPGMALSAEVAEPESKLARFLNKAMIDETTGNTLE